MSVPPHEVDVSWEVLRRIVRQWAGESAELEEVSPLIGGSINTTLLLKTRAGDQAVLKICPHRINREYADEASQLRLLAHHGLPVPKVYEAKIGTLEDPFSYLLMQYVQGVDLHEMKIHASQEDYDRVQTELAHVVSDLHNCTAETYRRVCHENGHDVSAWPTFFRSVYDNIWHHVDKSKLLAPKCRKHLHKIHERIDRTLQNADCPRLIHGDLWATNVLVKKDENGNWKLSALIDPNCKFAHAEMEIAYLELFHTVNHSFVKTYQQRHKLNGEYHRVRKWVYQMYFLLDHVNLFGQEYIKPLEQAVERALAVA